MKSIYPAFAVAILTLLPASVPAAPPKLDYLFPAGGQRGTTIDITAAGAFERWPVKIHVEGAGIDVKPGKASGKLTVAIAKDAEPGVRWIRIYDDDGASIARPFIVGLLPEVLEQEPNDDSKKPHVLDKTSVVVNGRLDKPGDVDTFAVKLTRGQTLIASLEAHHTLRSPMDGILQILSSDGFVLEQNDDYHEFDPQIAFTVPKDGTYLVRLFAFPAVADATIRFAGKENFIYRLTLTTGAFVEYTIPLTVSQDGPKEIELAGWNLPDKLRRFPVAPKDGAGVLNLFDARIANPFSIRVVPEPSCVKTKESPHIVKAPSVVTGRLDRAGASDLYEVNAKKGEKLSFRIASRTLGFPLDPVLRLLDNAGKTLAQSKAAKIGADASLDYTATQDGAYRLEVSDLHRDGGFRYVYRLHVGPTAPEFELKVVGDNFRVGAEKPLDIPVTVTRLGGFKEEVALSVEGAPKHVSVAATGKAITLRLAGKTPFAGPIRIVGTAKDGTKRSALATVTELNRTTDSLWLHAR